MICMPDQPEDSLNMLIYPYFLIVSSIFLIITFLVYVALPEIRNIHGVTIMSQVASLAVMYITLGLIQLHVGGYDDPVSYRICIVLGIELFVFQISSWLKLYSILIESFQAWSPISLGCLRSPGWMWWALTSGGPSGNRWLMCQFLINIIRRLVDIVSMIGPLSVDWSIQ